MQIFYHFECIHICFSSNVFYIWFDWDVWYSKSSGIRSIDLGRIMFLEHLLCVVTAQCTSCAMTSWRYAAAAHPHGPAQMTEPVCACVQQRTCTAHALEPTQRCTLIGGCAAPLTSARRVLSWLQLNLIERKSAWGTRRWVPLSETWRLLRHTSHTPCRCPWSHYLKSNRCAMMQSQLRPAVRGPTQGYDTLHIGPTSHTLVPHSTNKMAPHVDRLLQFPMAIFAKGPYSFNECDKASMQSFFFSCNDLAHLKNTVFTRM